MWFHCIIALLTLCRADKLVFVGEVCRHGARAPMKTSTWDHWYWSEEELGMLTPKGISQHRSIGMYIRDHYIRNHQLLSPHFNVDEIRIISTNVSRTVISSLEQLMGIYPDLVYTVRPGQDPFVHDDNMSYQLHFECRENGYNQLLQAYRPDNCPMMGQLTEMVIQSRAYQKHERQTQGYLDWETIRRISGRNASSIEELSDLVNDIKCDITEGLSIPPELDSLLTPGLSLETYYRYNVPFRMKESLPLMCSEFFTLLLSQMHGALRGGPLKLVIYSAHEMTVGALMLCLDLNPTEIPDFAATLFFELYDSGRVQVIYEYQVVDLTVCSSNCYLKEFEAHLHKFMVPDITEACELGSYSVFLRPNT